MVDASTLTKSPRECGCRSYRTKMGDQEVWAYDYCLRETGMSKAAAKLAMVFFTSGIKLPRASA